jgi:hypothetical protein
VIKGNYSYWTVVYCGVLHCTVCTVYTVPPVLRLLTYISHLFALRSRLQSAFIDWLPSPCRRLTGVLYSVLGRPEPVM